MKNIIEQTLRELAALQLVSLFGEPLTEKEAERINSLQNRLLELDREGAWDDHFGGGSGFENGPASKIMSNLKLWSDGCFESRRRVCSYLEEEAYTKDGLTYGLAALSFEKLAKEESKERVNCWEFLEDEF